MNDIILKLAATKLKLSPGRPDARGTESLRKLKKLAKRSRGDLESSLISAAAYAKEMNKTMFVFLGNSYMHAVWNVSDKPSVYLNPINNTGTKVASISPDLTMTWYDVERERPKDDED